MTASRPGSSPPTVAPGTRLPDDTRLGEVELIVGDLDRAIAFYTGTLGLQAHRRGEGLAALGAGEEDLLLLRELPGARPAGRHAGLYHVALLFPSREELARALARIAAARSAIQGASDHGTHEAIYLADPDGNGLELAADRPRERWTSFEEEFARGGPLPLDMHSLLEAAGPGEPPPQAGAGLRVGHIHLHVGDVERGLRFYRDVIGFEPTAVLPSAAFLSAGGYHHHIAINTWRGTGVGPAPPGAVGLRHWTVLVGKQDALAALCSRAEAAGLEALRKDGAVELADPWNMVVRVALAPQPAQGAAH